MKDAQKKSEKGTTQDYLFTQGVPQGQGFQPGIQAPPEADPPLAETVRPERLALEGHIKFMNDPD